MFRRTVSQAYVGKMPRHTVSAMAPPRQRQLLQMALVLQAALKVQWGPQVERCTLVRGQHPQVDPSLRPSHQEEAVASRFSDLRQKRHCQRPRPIQTLRLCKWRCVLKR